MQNLKKVKKSISEGFTLIELLVVIAIIGILTTLLLVNLVGVRERGSDTRKKANLNQLKTSLRLYYNDYQGYPASDGSGNLLGCTNGVSICSKDGGSELTNASGTTTYMKSTPEYGIYSATPDGESFYIGVELQNASDPDISKSVTDCNIPSPTDGYFYVCTD